MTRIENNFINNKYIDKYIFVEFRSFCEKMCTDFCELIDGIYSKSFGEEYGEEYLYIKMKKICKWINRNMKS